MALTLTDVTTANSTTAGATLDVTGITASVGDMLVLACAADNAGASGVSSISASITDGEGNTWTRQSETNQTSGGAAADGTTLSIWTSLLTAALSSDTITINFSPNTTSKVAILKRVQPGAGEVPSVLAVGPGVAGAGTTQTSGAVAVTSGDTIIGFTAAETLGALTADSDTTDGTWSTIQTDRANTGNAGTSQRIGGQQKTVTGTGNQTYNTSLGASVDYALNYIILQPLTAVDITLAAPGEIETDGAAPEVGTSGNTTLAAAGAIEIAGAAPSWLSSVNITVRVAGGIRLRGFRPTVTPDNTLTWPSTLPVPLMATHGFRPQAQMLRTDMEQGAARQRRLSRTTPSEAPFSLVLDQEQMATLEAWFDHVADYGGQWFTIELMAGTGYRTHVVRLMGEIDYKQIRKDRWLVTGTFEMQERPMLTEAELDALIGETS